MKKQGVTSRELLSVIHLTIAVEQSNEQSLLLNDLNFSIRQNEVLGLIGKSGSGKTLTALSLLGLLPPTLRILSGEIIFQGKNLLRMPPRELRQVRGKDIVMIFQDALGALNPVIPVGEQIADVIRAHLPVNQKTARARTIKLLEAVRLPMPEKIYQSYPHQLSGGMAQRVMIAMALSCSPGLIIADEPTSALDVTTQVEIIRLLRRLQTQYRFGMLFISHDLPLVSRLADRIAVINGGTIVECDDTDTILHHPENEATRVLFSAHLLMNTKESLQQGSYPLTIREGWKK